MANSAAKKRSKEVVSGVAAPAEKQVAATKGGKKSRSDNPGAKPPPFTLKDLKDSIPAHCFERSALYSSLYIVMDAIGIAILYFLSQQIDTLNVAAPIRWALWGAYWYAQGVVATGIWVIAHECGHQAFSSSETINNTVGLVLHSILLVPYHPWRISHAKHHMHTNHTELDEVFVPRTKAEAGIASHPIMKTPIVVVLRTILMLLIGWPVYLLFNVAGRKYDRPANHFNPYSPIFLPKERLNVVISDIALLVVLAGLGYLAHCTSIAFVVKVYFIPYLFVNMWLVLITELQHTDATIPHYTSEEWTWLRGALATVDRDYGILNYFHHHIADTHICHHIFSKIPHYHAEEATRHMKKVLGEYYRFDNTPVFLAAYRSMRDCIYIEDNEHVAWWRS